MTQPLGQINKPEAEAFKKGRKLYLVPLFLSPPDPPSELRGMLDDYWEGAQEHIARMEASLGAVNRIYHEAVFLSGEEGAHVLEQVNPMGYRMLRARYYAGAHLEATEDRALVEESSDWQRCLSLGLVSEKAGTTVIQAYVEVVGKRYQHIGSRVDETLQADESGVLVIGDNHRVQFPADIQVFYIAPPALDNLRRWINDQMSSREPGPPPAEEETAETS
jgi:hypothetical protein